MNTAMTSLRQVFTHHQAVLLDSLHDAALNLSGWARFLQHLVTLSDSRSARLLVMDRHASRVHYSAKVNIDDDEHARYVAHFVNTCPWRPELLSKPPGQLYSSRLDFSCSQRSYYRTEFFNDWAHGLDIHHGLCGTVLQEDDCTVQVLIQRTRGQGHFSAATRDAFNMLMPQVRHTLRLSRSIAQREQGLQAVACAAQHSVLPCMVFDASGRMMHLSAQAASALAPLIAGSDDNGPTFSLARHRRQFSQLLQRARADLLQRQFLHTHTLTLPRPLRPALVLSAMALRPEFPSRHLLPSAPGALAVYVQDPLQERCIDTAALCQLFALTPGEARVAAAIASGLTARDIAEQYGCSLHTVRSQLKTVLRKTGTHRQAELTLLILTSTAMRSVQPLPGPG